MLKYFRKDINHLKKKHQLIKIHMDKYYNKFTENDFLDFFPPA